MEQQPPRRYEQPPTVSRDEVERILASGDTERIAEAMVGMVFHEPDWRWAQMQALRCAQHSDDAVRYVGVLCLGHLARLHGQLDVERVLPLLLQLRADPQTSARVRAYVEHALWDINIYAERELLRRAGWTHVVKELGWSYNRSTRRWEPPAHSDADDQPA